MDEQGSGTALLERPQAGEGGTGLDADVLPEALPETGGGDGKSGSAAVATGDGLADNAGRAVLGGLGAVAGLALLPLVLVIVGVGVLSTLLEALNPFDGGGTNGELIGLWPASGDIPAVYRPMYEAAAERYHVNPFLLASIHKQETGFSTNLAARAGRNAWGAAGPMQFLLTTWVSHDKAFKAIANARPASYPLNRRLLPSCAGVPADLGCVYDDFDAIAGAAHKLRADGADESLTSAGTRRAVCAYIGACSEVDRCTGSVNQYCQVLPRARKWELEAGAMPGGGGETEKAVTWALTQQGVVEKPFGSDCGGPIGDWQRRTGTTCGVAWCGVFVHEALLHAGIDFPSWIASVPTTLDKARAGAGGLRAVPKNQIKRGDIVIFQWDTGDPDHMGLAVKDYDGQGELTAIEGNTTNGVHLRTHAAGVIVAGARVLKGAG